MDESERRHEVRVGYHASHEQFAPSALLGWAKRAEAAGFRAAMCSDHFAPWSARQPHSGYSWAWLGAALGATSLPMGVVTAPGQRQHPALVAQAAATLAEMFPGRFWMALGSGEALNEHITGDRWPPKPVRQARLAECVAVIRRLFAGEAVTHDGLVRVADARLYTRPATPPMIYGAAVSAETAAWVATWADGLITVNQPRERLVRVAEAFRRAGGEGKPMALQVHVAHAADEATALAEAHDQWRFCALAGDLMWDLPSPAHFDAATQHVRPEDLRDAVRIAADPRRHVGWMEEDAALGFSEIYLHHVGRDQDRFIDDFAARVLPAFAR